MSTSADVVVIGAGVIGSSIALELSRQDRSVIVIDKAGGIGHGSTSASSAVIRFNYSSWSGVAAAWESMHCWDDWSAHLDAAVGGPLAKFERTGILVISGGSHEAELSIPYFERAGIPWERWDAEILQDRLPQIESGSFWPPKPVRAPEFFGDPTGHISGVYTPDGGHVDDPQLAAHNLGSAAKAFGARYLLNAEVKAIVQPSPRSWSVTLADGREVSSNVVVNAAGPWSSSINSLAGVGGDFTVQTRPMRQEVHYVPAPASMSGEVRTALADLDLGIYLRTTGHEGLLVGGTEPECDPFEWLDDVDAADPRPTSERFEAQVLRAARRVPDLGIPNRPTGVAGVYDVTPDWTPIYDRTDREGFYVAIGTSGNQFKNAPVAGQLMAALIDAVEGGHDHDADPFVYKAPRTGHEIDLRTYSRRRPLDPDAPATVMG